MPGGLPKRFAALFDRSEWARFATQGDRNQCAQALPTETSPDRDRPRFDAYRTRART